MGFSLQPYTHVLLDMNGTFLFEYDRFGLEQDFAATYQDLGFSSLPNSSVQSLVRAAYDYMIVRYLDEAYHACFPTVPAAIRATCLKLLEQTVVKSATAEEELLKHHAREVLDNQQLLQELTSTFAMHELGHLPHAHLRALDRLRKTCPISVLSNLWAPKDNWLTAFAEWGIESWFATLTFSSDGAFIKPHPGVFAGVVEKLGVESRQVLYIGDSYRCDVEGAKAAGMDAVWLTTQGRPDQPPPHLKGVYADLPTFVDDIE